MASNRKHKVPLYGSTKGTVEVESGATAGATVGKDLRWPSGAVVKESELRGTSSPSSSGTSSGSSTLWRLIREIPANIQKLAALTGTGLASRKTDGEWALRTLQGGTGIDVQNGGGDSGDPTVSLSPLTDTGTGTALVKITRDAYGRVEGTEAATTDDLPEGETNQYFHDAPSDGATYGRKDGEWAEVTQVALSLPFWLSDGTETDILLTSNYELPFWLTDGTQSNIAMVS